VIQAVSYEFRKKPDNFLGAKTYEVFLVLNGFFGTILVGTAVGTFFNGAMFSLDEMNHVTWATPFRGLEAVLTFHKVALVCPVFPFWPVCWDCCNFMNSVSTATSWNAHKSPAVQCHSVSGIVPLFLIAWF
jgi:cytochrome d ubiquinol oxidase subunit II